MDENTQMIKCFHFQVDTQHKDPGQTEAEVEDKQVRVMDEVPSSTFEEVLFLTIQNNFIQRK